METYTVNDSINEILANPLLVPFAPYMLYENRDIVKNADEGFFAQVEKAPIEEVRKLNWSPEGMVGGANFLLDRAEKGKAELLPIYEGDACDAPQKQDICMIRLMPDEYDPEKPTVILAAGGSYAMVCTITESLPAARHFVEQGFQTFLVNYRVNEKCVGRKALDDLAQAIRYLDADSAALGVDITKLVIGGFSAGANLISNWGVPGLGWEHYGLPKPMALLPIYTLIDLKAEQRRDVHSWFLKTMLGDDVDAAIDEFNIIDRIDGSYPPCYIVVGKNDAVVSAVNSERMKELLDRAGVTAVLEEPDDAQHGFGDGTGTGAEGWPLRAIQFIEKL